MNRLVQYLSIFFYTVYKAGNGKEGLELYKKHLPNVILTDIDMPKLSGVELTQKIREVDKNKQVIILSAYTNTEDFLKLVPLNLVSYLVKPIKMVQLKDAVFEAIENIRVADHIILNDGYAWDKTMEILLKDGKKVDLSSAERSFIEILVVRINRDVSYEDIHNNIYNLEEYSQNALFMLVKKIRKKPQKTL